MKTYDLNPDFRRTAPNKGRYCACCQKPIKETAKAVAVTVNWENWETAEGHDIKLPRRNTSGKVIDNCDMGTYCFKKMLQRPYKCD